MNGDFPQAIQNMEILYDKLKDWIDIYWGKSYNEFKRLFAANFNHIGGLNVSFKIIYTQFQDILESNRN